MCVLDLYVGVWAPDTDPVGVIRKADGGTGSFATEHSPDRPSKPPQSGKHDPDVADVEDFLKLTEALLAQ